MARTVRLLLLHLLLLGVFSQRSLALGLENSPLTTVSAVVGQSVLLPCNITSSSSTAAPVLIIFYYGNKATPVYSVDARKSSVYSGKHWADPDQLGTRGRLVVRTGQQGLFLSRLVPEDAGQYHCRLDYRSGPTKNYLINLEMITPPRHMLVTSSWDEGRIVSGQIGPYPEGADLTLACQVTGGHPPPSVIWWQGGALLDESCEVRTEQVTRNSLRLPRLTREDLLRQFTCIASNNNITSPLSQAITIDIAFPPTSVRIWLENGEDNDDHDERLFSDSSGHEGRQQPPLPPPAKGEEHKVVTVHADQEAYLSCEAYGSRPQAFVLWKKNGRLLVNSEQVSTTQSSIIPRGGSSVSSVRGDAASKSSLRLVPSVGDHKAVVSCTTYSPTLPDEALVDDVTLNVLYRPRISLSYDSTVNATTLEVGDSFTLVCHVDSNPPAGDLQWAKDGVPLQSSSPAGILIRGDRLEVSSASRHLTGGYTCAAANSQGVNTSQPLHLRIKFAPVCNSQQQAQYGAGRKEGIEVTCSVDSHPAPLTFRWAFNQSSHIKDIPQSSFSNSGTVSTLRYIPHTEQDFGSLLCWAANDVGLMREPCVMQVVPAAKPEAVENCRVLRNSTMPRSVALISCSPGYDGGLNQTFALEVREHRNLHSRPMASVQHSPIPVFNIKRLKHGEQYVFIITAVNARGTSPPTTLSYTVPPSLLTSMASNAYDNSQTTWISWTLFIAVIFGGLITALICFCGALFFMKFRPPTHAKNSAKIVYAGPIRSCPEKDRMATLGPHSIIRCGKAGCEDEKPVKVDYIQRVKDDCFSTLEKHRSDELSKESERFLRNSGSDVRLCTPHSWTHEGGCRGEDTYVRNQGYHMHSLSPPPPPLLPPSLPPPHTGRSSLESLANSSSNSNNSSRMTSEPRSDGYYDKGESSISSRTPLMVATSIESDV